MDVVPGTRWRSFRRHFFLPITRFDLLAQEFQPTLTFVRFPLYTTGPIARAGSKLTRERISYAQQAVALKKWQLSAQKNNNMQIGKKIWAIAEGYIPGWSHGPAPAFTSHEAACILNAGDREANIELIIYFADRPPAGPYKINVPAERTLHLRFNNLADPEKIPLETPYSSLFVSDVPVVIQFTRLDSRQEANALITTIAYAE